MIPTIIPQSVYEFALISFLALGTENIIKIMFYLISYILNYKRILEKTIIMIIISNKVILLKLIHQRNPLI